MERVPWDGNECAGWEGSWQEVSPGAKLDCFGTAPVAIVQGTRYPSTCKIVAAFFKYSLDHGEDKVLDFVGKAKVWSGGPRSRGVICACFSVHGGVIVSVLL